MDKIDKTCFENYAITSPRFLYNLYKFNTDLVEIIDCSPNGEYLILWNNGAPRHSDRTVVHARTGICKSIPIRKNSDPIKHKFLNNHRIIQLNLGTSELSIIRVSDTKILKTIKLPKLNKNTSFDIDLNEKYVAVPTKNKVAIIDLESGNILYEFVVNKNADIDIEGVVKFSPDGKYLLCKSERKENEVDWTEIKIWKIPVKPYKKLNKNRINGNFVDVVVETQDE